MPITNMSQILLDVTKHVHFARKEQEKFVFGYSFVSRFLNTDSISTRALSYSRVEYISLSW